MTKEEYRELEILLGGLQVVGLAKRTEERLERSLQVIHRDKQLLISGVVKSLPTRDEAKIEMKDYVINYYEDSETKEMLEFAIGFMHCLNWITEKNKK